MKKIILSLLLIATYFFNYAQTNVSGGIFSNTTWTLAGSPYIVTGIVVVFPGITLTIEPGVIVKFDNAMYLEIRQATLIANGTITDSITFTSNDPSPTPGIWGNGNSGGIYLNGSAPNAFFNFCNISYATSGLAYVQHIKNSRFVNNITGIYGIYNITVDSCVFIFNSSANYPTGINNVSSSTLNYCTVNYLSGIQPIGISDVSNSTLNHCNILNSYFGIEESNNAVFNHCVIDSNHRAFGGATGLTGNTSLFDCSVSHNDDGFIAGNFQGGNSLQHCVMNNNTAAVIIWNVTNNSIIHCEIKYNTQGVQTNSNTVISHCDFEYDSVGIVVSSSAVNMYCNKICNNISYGLKMGTSANFNASDNYWCTTDSAQIAAAIYDGYDNVIYGLVTFLPTDSTCYQSTGVYEVASAGIGFTIFPNPATSTIHLTFNTKHNGAVRCEIRNVMGERVYEAALLPAPLTPKGESSAQLDVSFLAKGIYLIRVGDGERWENRKLVVD